jgi:hypothetical protein
MASATVGLAITSCQFSTGSWLVTTVHDLSNEVLCDGWFENPYRRRSA